MEFGYYFKDKFYRVGDVVSITYEEYGESKVAIGKIIDTAVSFMVVLDTSYKYNSASVSIRLEDVVDVELIEG